MTSLLSAMQYLPTYWPRVRGIFAPARCASAHALTRLEARTLSIITPPPPTIHSHTLPYHSHSLNRLFLAS